ncbi:hypothetical protein F4860DRAFT_494650 [Xylaria cubensis]|nr:hypothetical protein F4860DRAFT_494650 [Xylaria cubensis]
MAREQFDKYTWGGEVLLQDEELPETLDDCARSPVKLTAYILNTLIASEFNDVQIILDMKKIIVRLVEIKEIMFRGETLETRWDLDNPTHATAFAYYLFMDKEPAEPCKQCTSKNCKGPCKECIAGSYNEMKGACTNCYYSGNGHRCSHRRETEKKKIDEKVSAAAQFVGFAREVLKEATDAELAMWIGWIREEKAAREENNSPSKKRRLM